MRLLIAAFLIVHPFVLQTVEFQRPWGDPKRDSRRPKIELAIGASHSTRR
jgi:hypothetical protein